MTEFINVKVGDENLRLFKSVSNQRLETETRLEFRMRRKFVNDEIKERKKYGIEGRPQIKRQ